MLADERGEAIMLLPHFVGHHRGERRRRHINGEIHRAPVPLVYDHALAARGVVSDEETGDFVDGFLRGRQSDALQAASPLPACAQSASSRSSVSARCSRSTRSDDCVDLVNDHGTNRSQHLAASFGGQQQIQRLWGRHQNVRRRLEHRRPLRRRGVAGSHRGRDAGDVDAG